MRKYVSAIPLSRVSRWGSHLDEVIGAFHRIPSAAVRVESWSIRVGVRNVYTTAGVAIVGSVAICAR